MTDFSGGLPCSVPGEAELQDNMTPSKFILHAMYRELPGNRIEEWLETSLMIRSIKLIVSFIRIILLLLGSDAGG